VKISEQGSIAVVSELPAFDHNTAFEFAGTVTQRVGKSLPTNVVVDLSETKGIYSAAIVELVGLEDVLRSCGGVLVLAGIPKEALAAIRAARLDTFFLIAPDVAAAVEKINTERGASV